MRQSKVNKSKVNKSNVTCGGKGEKVDETTATYGPHGHVRLTADEFDKLFSEYGAKVITEYIGKVDRYINKSGSKPYDSHFETIKEWLSKDGVKPKPAPSFDLAEIVERAKHSTPKI